MTVLGPSTPSRTRSPGKRRRAASVHAEHEQGPSHAAPPSLALTSTRSAAHAGTILYGPRSRGASRRMSHMAHHPGARGDSGPASAASDRGPVAALPVPDRRQPVLHELGAVGVRARGTSRRPFRVPRHGVVSASSGTAALVGAILATAGRATVDRPLAYPPALTFVATAIAVEQCGYQVYLADASSDDWILDVRALSSHPMLALYRPRGARVDVR